jgi:threonylcarbamoyladenosine tRNA methylthiotransferase MtaB
VAPKAGRGGLRVALTTLGCRLNAFETDAMSRMAQEAGHTIVDFDGPADVVVVNTCTITAEADADSRQRVRQATRRSPGAQVVVTGCYANAAPAALQALPGVALVLGNLEKERWLELLGARSGERVDVVVSDLTRHRRMARLRPDNDPRRSRALLKIQDGCDYRCSFCVVPAVRGRSVSLPRSTIAAQLEELVAAGLPEVVLTGAHLGTYGRDLGERGGLAALVEGLLPRLGGARLRLGSLDPHEVDERLIALIEGSEGAICRHLHLPVQSGDDEVLRRMRRAHTSADLAALVPRLVAAIPGISIGTDVIAGFPGESEAAFERTFALLEALPIAYMHVFPYSRRAGTAAAEMDAQVPAATRAARCGRLRALSRRKAAALRASMVGQALSVVVQRQRERLSGRLIGLTDNYVEVLFDGDDALLGAAAAVRIVEAGEARALGRLIGR